jgi:hypothetical protein
MQSVLLSWIDDIFDSLIHPIGTGVFFIIYTVIFVGIIIFLVHRMQIGSKSLPDGVTRIIASTGDVSAGIAGAKKLKFIKSPSTALVFLKIEENAIQQAMSAADYFVQQGEIDEAMKSKIGEVYQARLDAVRTAIAKDEELREVMATSSAVDKARSDYLRKLAAMSGTTVETETEAAGPTSVGMPTPGRPSGPKPKSKGPAGPPSGGRPSEGPPSGGPPGGGPPGGGPPSGGPPMGGEPLEAAPIAEAPPAVVPSIGGPPSGPPAMPAGPPGGSPPAAGPVPSSRPPAAAGGAKSSLQSEMLAEMERLRALMGE